MRGLLFLFALLALGAGVAYATRPDAADVEEVLRQEVMRAVAERDIGAGRSTAQNLALTACKLRPSNCYDLLRSGLDVTIDETPVYIRVDVAGFERRATCYGVFGRFTCPGGLKASGS